MPRFRTIPRNPEEHKNYYLIDANVLAYKALPKSSNNKSINASSSPNEYEHYRRCVKWWKIIEKQLKNQKARVYIPDICIAEAFKVLAKWYYRQKFLKDVNAYTRAKRKLRKFVSTSHSEMSRAGRFVYVHDIPTNRDIIIAVDRFFEFIFKANNINLSVADLIILASAKYLMDFYDIPKSHLYILSCDKSLIRIAKKMPDMPYAFDPSEEDNDANKRFK